ncbi:helix-turn-helix domain-containing protein [Pedobacter immunditicola]|uniref:helix-turn-helix domain-containing protein n=1 Tax=Pedobacter immunditicola TaxID=3133440 RepID=UPI0030966631
MFSVPLIVKPTPQELSIDQILSVFGETLQDESLHVFVQEEAMYQVPINLPFRLDHYCVILVTSGECEMQFDLISHTQRKNDLIVIVPATMNEFIRVSEDYHFKLVSFSVDFPIKLGVNEQHAEAFSFFTRQHSLILSLTDEESSVIAAQIDLLNQKTSIKDHPFRAELILHSFTLLMFEISALFKNHFSIAGNQLSRNEALSLRFLNLLTQNIATERTVQFYADQLAVTPNYLNKLSKKTLHKTARSFIDEMVIQESKILLHKSALSILQIAESLHFKDQFHFSKFFKKKTGLNPSAYRKIKT